MIPALTNLFIRRHLSIFSTGKLYRERVISSFQLYQTLPALHCLRFMDTMSSATKPKGGTFSGRNNPSTQQRKQRNQFKDPAAASHAASRIDVSVIGTGCRGTPRAVLIQSIFSKYAIFYLRFLCIYDRYLFNI